MAIANGIYEEKVENTSSLLPEVLILGIEFFDMGTVFDSSNSI